MLPQESVSAIFRSRQTNSWPSASSRLHDRYRIQFGARKIFGVAEVSIMPYSHTVRGVKHFFADLRTLLAKASPLRSGDQLAGLAAAGAEERAIAQMTLADLPLKVFKHEAVVPYECDAVTR